jgi:hypothetical protein
MLKMEFSKAAAVLHGMANNGSAASLAPHGNEDVDVFYKCVVLC